MKKVLVLAGAPGAGKGTLSKRMQDCLTKENISYSLIAVSSLLKEDKVCKKLIEKGKLINDEQVISVVEGALLLAEDVIILDGFPRTKNQAYFMQKLQESLEYEITLLEMEADDNEILERIENRRICKKCDASYNLLKKSLMPKEEGICDVCGGKLIIRPDDKKIVERLQIYHKETEPAIDYLNQNGFDYYVITSHEIMKKQLAEEILYDLGVI